MNTFLGVIFVVLAVINVIGILGGPFLIGKERKPWTPGNYIFAVITGVFTVIALVIAAGVMFGGGQ